MYEQVDNQKSDKTGPVLFVAAYSYRTYCNSDNNCAA